MQKQGVQLGKGTSTKKKKNNYSTVREIGLSVKNLQEI